MTDEKRSHYTLSRQRTRNFSHVSERVKQDNESTVTVRRTTTTLSPSLSAHSSIKSSLTSNTLRSLRFEARPNRKTPAFRRRVSVPRLSTNDFRAHTFSRKTFTTMISRLSIVRAALFDLEPRRTGAAETMHLSLLLFHFHRMISRMISLPSLLFFFVHACRLP